MTTQRRPKPQENTEPEGEEMTTEAPEKTTSEFPKTIAGKTFQTPQELADYAKELNDLNKEVKELVKATKPGRPASQKKLISTAVSDFLNENMSDDLRLALGKVEGDFNMRLNLKDGVFTMPVAAPRGEGTGGNRGGRKIVVDGQEFPSAKNARDTLHPEMKDKSQNYKAIVKYLQNEKHEVVEDTA